MCPLFQGEGGGDVWGRASLESFEISKPQNAIFSVLGTKIIEDKRACLSFKKM